MKTLDDNGLTRVWVKIKAAFQPKLVSGTNIKTINSQSLLGSGDIAIANIAVTEKSNEGAALTASQSDPANWYWWA